MSRLLVRTLAAAVSLAALVPLGACSQGTNDDGPAGESEATERETLAAAIGGAPGLTTLSDALSGAGLADVFDGPGSYTVLAPDDDAFATLGKDGKALTDPSNRAELVAILRGHILPGHLTPDAIKKAIADKKGPVKMRTLSDSMVTFSTEGDGLAIAGENGARARIDGDALIASNGVVLPVDGLVKAAPKS